MDLFEYEAKQEFSAYGIPVPQSTLVTRSYETVQATSKLTPPFMIKAQVLVGGRGKAGGVKLAQTADQVEQSADRILGMDIKGLPVRKVLVDHMNVPMIEYVKGVSLPLRWGVSNYEEDAGQAYLI